MSKKEIPDFTQNRELSWLRFNQRVLEEARDESVPLMERMKFVAIFTSNLDEFFMIRVGSLYDLFPATPPLWNVRMVSCVPGSPMDCAAIIPTASPTCTASHVAMFAP